MEIFIFRTSVLETNFVPLKFCTNDYTINFFAKKWSKRLWNFESHRSNAQTNNHFLTIKMLMRVNLSFFNKFRYLIEYFKNMDIP